MTSSSYSQSAPPGLPRVMIAGCGPGAPECVTPEARQAVMRADALVGASRLLDLFPDAPGERVAVGAGIDAALDAVARLREAGRAVAVLVTGDPGVCSLARPAIRRFGVEACRVIAGVSSVQVAFARIGQAWDDARIVNAHAGPPERGADFATLATERKIAILCGRAESLAWAADLLEYLCQRDKQKGMDRPSPWRAWVAEDLTLPGERVAEATPGDFRLRLFGSRAIVVLIREEEDASS